MTLVAVRAAPDRACILVDSLRYVSTGRWVGKARRPKALRLPGIDAATVCAGDFDLAQQWQRGAVAHAGACGDFDRVASEWPAIFAQQCPDPAELIVWLAGWSRTRGRFVACAGVSADGFRLADVSDALNVMPAVPGFTPTVVEQSCRDSMGLAPLPDGDAYPAPRNDLEWRELAEDVHEGRAETLDPDLKVLIGGDVTLMEITRGSVERRVVHTFGELDRVRMLRGTIHPSVQLGPCICGSGVRMLECHLPEIFDRPCICRSGARFADCCIAEPMDARP